MLCVLCIVHCVTYCASEERDRFVLLSMGSGNGFWAHCALRIVPAKCAKENVLDSGFWQRDLGSGHRQLATGSGIWATATGNELWATATGNGLWATATGNGDPEAALLKHEGRPREATGGQNGDGNRQPRFWGVNS